MLAPRSYPIKSVRQNILLKLHRDTVFGEVSKTADRSRAAAKLPIPTTWHDANSNARVTRFGVAPFSFRKTSSRGGARNSASRESHALSRAQVANLIAAADHADAIGLPFTRFITIHWQAAGVALEGMAKATGRFIDMLSKALARHGSRTAWLWVHENKMAHETGGHCHILAHVPARLVSKVTKLQMRWLRTITGKPYRARVIESKPVGGRLGLEVGNPALHLINRDVALSYALKGAISDAARTLGLVRLKAQGRIVGKRCGVSQNIGPKARKALQTK